MDDQVKDEVEAVAEGDTSEAVQAEASSDRYSTGIKPLDDTVYKVDAGVRKIDAGVRWISNEIHNFEVEESPDRPRVSSGIQPLDKAVYAIDHGVRRISDGLHKAVGAVKKQQ